VASQMYVIQAELDLIRARAVVEDVTSSYNYEVNVFNGGAGPNPENKDCWGTLLANAVALKSQLDKLIEAMKKEYQT
jgi:hypothetical protein